MKKMWAGFSAFLVILLALRFTQLFLAPLPEHLFSAVLLSATLVLIGLTILFSALNKEITHTYTPVKSIPCGIFGAGASIAIIYRSIYDIYNVLILKEFPSRTFITEHPAFYAVLSCLGIISAMLFLVISLSHFIGTSPLRKLPLLTLLIPLWYCYGLIIEFVTAISRRNSVENSIEVLSMVFTLMYLFFEVKVLSGIEEKASCKNCFLLGLPAVIASFCSSAFYFAAKLTKIEFNSALSERLHYVNLLMAFYILFFLIASARQKNYSEPSSEPELPEKEETFEEGSLLEKIPKFEASCAEIASSETEEPSSKEEAVVKEEPEKEAPQENHAAEKVISEESSVSPEETAETTKEEKEPIQLDFFSHFEDLFGKSEASEEKPIPQIDASLTEEEPLEKTAPEGLPPQEPTPEERPAIEAPSPKNETALPEEQEDKKDPLDDEFFLQIKSMLKDSNHIHPSSEPSRQSSLMDRIDDIYQNIAKKE